MARKARKVEKSGVPRELERAGALCLAFANTGVSRRDDRRKEPKAPPSMALAHYGELVTWGQRMDVVDATAGERLRRLAAERPQDAAAVCALAARLRAAVVRIFTSGVLDKEPRPEDLATLNGLLRLRRVVPAGDGFGLDWVGDEAALDLPLWAVAQSAAELLTSGDAGRVNQCAAKGCYQLFVSRSRQRLWCDMNTCGNRVKGRRYQQYRRDIKKQGRLREAERHRERERAKAAAASAPVAPKASERTEGSEAEEAASKTSTNPRDRLEPSQPTEGKGSERPVPGPYNRTVA